MNRISVSSFFVLSLFGCSVFYADSYNASAVNSGTAMQNKSLECNTFPLGGEIGLALDTYHSLPDGSWGGNMGALANMNLAYCLPAQQEGFGIQLGGSYGLYDWDGRGSTNSSALQQEAFLSVGLFRMTPCESGVNAGLVYDWQFNKQSGVFGLDPVIAQLRGQLGYLFRGGNEVGVWSAYSTRTDVRYFNGLPVKFRAISQVSAYWRHVFHNLGEIMLWAGTPYQKGLMYYSGRPGNFIAGASFKAPLTRRLSVVGQGVYMTPASSSVYYQSMNYGANVNIGISYAFGGEKAGSKPYLPVANNSNMIVDTSLSW